MELTHKFKMPSGVMCEILPADFGDFEALLTAAKRQSNFNDALTKVLATKILSIGSKNLTELEPYQREKFVSEMMPSDLDMCLLTMRQLSYEFPEEFVFFFLYDENGKQLKKRFSMPLENGNFQFQATEPQYEEYSEIQDSFQVTINGKIVRIPIMAGENAIKAKKAAKGKNDITLTDALALRGCAMKQTPDSDWVGMTANDFKRMMPNQIAMITSEIEKREGKVFASHTIEHPKTGEQIPINILATKDFFLSEV